MADTRRRARQCDRPLRVAGRHQRERVGEDLRSICSASVLPLRAIEPLSGAWMPRLRFRYAVCSVERPSLPTKDRAVLDDVVQPVVAGVGRCAAITVLDDPAEGEGSGDVVVGNDQGKPEVVVHEPVDQAETGPDVVVRPPSTGRPRYTPMSLPRSPAYTRSS